MSVSAGTETSPEPSSTHWDLLWSVSGPQAPPQSSLSRYQRHLSLKTSSSHLLHIRGMQRGWFPPPPLHPLPWGLFLVDFFFTSQTPAWDGLKVAECCCKFGGRGNQEMEMTFVCLCFFFFLRFFLKCQFHATLICGCCSKKLAISCVSCAVKFSQNAKCFRSSLQIKHH